MAFWWGVHKGTKARLDEHMYGIWLASGHDLVSMESRKDALQEDICFSFKSSHGSSDVKSFVCSVESAHS
jgi:hypothetical protein